MGSVKIESMDSEAAAKVLNEAVNEEVKKDGCCNCECPCGNKE